MPVEFVRETCTAYGHYTVCDSTKLVMAYDGSGRRISKTRMKKTAFDGPWYATLVTHYTGIGPEVREGFHNGTREKVNVVVNMPVFFRVTLTRLKPRSYIEKDILRLSNGGAILPKRSFGASRQGLGRYGVDDAVNSRGNGKPFEWYLKNHLGSTMLVYGTQGYSWTDAADVGSPIAAYDYRAFGEQVSLAEPSDKVTENFTGKERDDETELDYFGARYLDPMLGMWTSVDPKRQFASPYLYAGNGVNPVNGVDGDGNVFNPFGLMVGVGTGVAASWDAQAEYRRVSGENYSPVKETIVGVVVYGAYVAAGATGISGGLLKSTLLGGLIGGTLSGGSVAVAEILGSENLEGLDGDKVAESFTKGFVTTASGAMLGAGVSEIMGGAAPLNFDNPSFGETVGGAVGGLTGLILDQCSTSEWDKDSAE